MDTTGRLVLSTAEAAKLIGMTKLTLEKWRSARRYNLPYIKIGGKVGYRRADIDAFLASRTVNGVDAPPSDLKAKPHEWKTTRPRKAKRARAKPRKTRRARKV